MSEGRHLLTRAVSFARDHDLEALRQLIDWPLTRAAAVARALREPASPARRTVDAILELDAATTRPELMDEVLQAAADRLAYARAVRWPATRDASAALSPLRLPVPPAGATETQHARLTRLRERAATAHEVMLLTEDEAEWPVACAADQDRLILFDQPSARVPRSPRIRMPLSRSGHEAALYMDLHGCPACGLARFSRKASCFSGTAGTIWQYAGACPGCGRRREFLFRSLPGPPAPPAPAGRIRFGGSRVSDLFDAGAWMRIAESHAVRHTAVPERLAADELGRVREDLARALAATEEVAKFVPEDADAVPESAFRAGPGRHEYAAAPDRYRRPAIDAACEAYRRLLNRLDQRVSPGLPGHHFT